MKVLVTGAPGWLGNRLTAELVRRGDDVTCLALPGVDGSALQQLGVRIVHGDVTDASSLTRVADGAEVVYHAAGLIHPTAFGLGSLNQVNAEGTQALLAEAVRAGARRFVYVSSNSAAGTNRSRSALMTEYTYERPYMEYGRSKLKAEQAVNDVHASGAIETTIVRPCWFYGPGQPERQTRLMKMIIAGKAPMFGDGMNLRSMTYVDSLCDALIRCGSEPAADGEIYWIADEKPYTTRHVYETLADLLGVELKTSNFPRVASDLSCYGDSFLQALNVYQMEVHVAGEMYKDIACDVSKAKKDLGWAPPTDLREGMRLSIEWAREHGLLDA